ncbi:MAG: AAA family ATPase [Alphaproteobacteria bacterium]|nr:AAA family ATPase [Alphaproteobacteria bacterium]
MSANPAQADVQPLDREALELARRTIPVAAEKLMSACDKVEEQMWGQRKNIELSLASILAGGSFLLEGKPGTGKTDTVKYLVQAIGLETKRIQGAPDLMPSDIIGTEVLNPDFDPEKKISEENPKFIFVPGPIFTQVLFVDEINRMSPKTQAALLQAMQENKVTVGGKDYLLPRPFLVVATQNPQEQEGTYPLPEAQKDRFLIKQNIGSVDTETSRRITKEKSAGSVTKFKELFEKSAAGENLTERKSAPGIVLESVLQKNDMIVFNALMAALPLNDEVSNAIVELVESTRPEFNSDIKEAFKEGSDGARAMLAIAKLVRARALLNGREAPDITDVKAVAEYVLIDRVKPHLSKIEDKEKTLKTLINKI